MAYIPLSQRKQKLDKKVGGYIPLDERPVWVTNKEWTPVNPITGQADLSKSYSGLPITGVIPTAEVKQMKLDELAGTPPYKPIPKYGEYKTPGGMMSGRLPRTESEPGASPIIKQAPPESTWGRLKDIASKPFVRSAKDRIARSQAEWSVKSAINDNYYKSLAEQTGKPKEWIKENIGSITTKDGKPVPFEAVTDQDVERNFDAYTKALGWRGIPTNQEYIGIMFTMGATAGMVLNPVATIKGLAEFMALSEAESGVISLIKGEPYKILQQKGLKDLLPSETNGVTKTLVDIIDLIAKGAVMKGIAKRSPAVIEKFTKNIATIYKLPQKTYIEADKIKDIFQTGKKISNQELELVKDLGLTGDQYKQAFRQGLTIEIPLEKVVTIADKPYWAKLKSLLRIKPMTPIIRGTFTAGEKVGAVPSIRGFLKAGDYATGEVLTTPPKVLSPNVDTGVNGLPKNAKPIIVPVKHAVPGVVKKNTPSVVKIGEIVAREVKGNGVTARPVTGEEVDYKRILKILRGTKGMTADDIMKKYPNIKLKRDVPAKDIYGNKVEISKGEKLTPYELKGNKVLLQDGQTYLVSKNQFQNIKGNAVSAEAKSFAPELKGVGGTVKGIKTKNLIEKIKKYDVPKNESDWSQGILEDAGVPKDLAQKWYNENIGYQETKYNKSPFVLPNGKNYREILIKAPDAKFNILKQKVLMGKSTREETRLYDKIKGNQYKSPHYPEDLNLISHLRMNDRTYKGKKVAFMEELQSDWAIDLRRDLQVATEEGLDTSEMPTPNHPLLKNWQILTIKRALQDAVERNADYFAWINGEQTSERYNLATYLDNVKWKNNVFDNGVTAKVVKMKPKNGNWEMIANVDKSGKIVGGSFHGQNWEGKKLDEVLGKGLADKIMSKSEGTLSGKGLSFGGEWTNHLYDEQVPNIVKDLTGADVIKMDMGLPIKSIKETEAWLSSDYKKLKLDDLKVGMKVHLGGRESSKTDYIITDVLGDGKFKAVPKETYDKLKSIENGTFKPKDKYDVSELAFKQEGWNRYKETFDISKPTTIQQGIELTPEIKAKIRGEAPKIKTSGKMFQATKQPKSVEPKPSTAKYKVVPGGIGKMISGKEAIRDALEIADRLKLTNLETEMVKKILTGDGGEAFAMTLRNKLTFIEAVPEFTGGHEMTHLLYRSVDGMKIFTNKGITSSRLDAELRKLYPNSKDLGEDLAVGFEKYRQERLQSKPITFRGKIRRFFDTIWNTLKKIFNRENRSIVKKFYKIVDKGRATETTVISREGPPKFKEIEGDPLPFKPKGWEEEMMVNQWKEALDNGEFYPKGKDRDYIGDILDGSLKLKIEKSYDGSKGIKSDAKKALEGLYSFVFRKNGTQAIDEVADGLNMTESEALEAIKSAFDKKKELLVTIKEHGKIAKEMIKDVIADQSQAYTTNQIQLFNKIAVVASKYKNVNDLIKSSYGAEFERATEIIAEAQGIDVGNDEALDIITNMPDIKDVNKAVGVKNTPEVIALPDDLKEKITFFDRPPAKRTPIAFSLLGNKKTTIPLLSEVFDKWAKDGVDTIIEPWSGAFTVPTFALRKAIESGLKEFHANVFDKEKYMIVKDIQDGKIGDVTDALQRTLKKYNKTLLKHAESDPLVEKTFKGFFRKYPNSWIGSMEWGKYVNEGKFNSLNTKAQNLKDEFLSFRDVFRDTAYELFDEEVTDLDSAVMNSFVKRIGIFGKKSQGMISDKGGFRVKHGVVFGKWGMMSGFKAMDEMFRFAKKNGANINLYSEDSEAFVKRFNDVDPQKTGWYSDPPYVSDARNVYDQEKRGVSDGEDENLKTADELSKFISGKMFYDSHKNIFDSHNAGARTAWTNAQDEEYFRTMMDKLDGVDPDGLFGYRELQTPTSFITDSKTSNPVRDFLSTEIPLTGYREDEYLEHRLAKFHGYTDKLIDALVDRGIKREKAEQLRIEGRFLKDLVKVKREKTGEVSAIISKKALEYIKKNYNVKGVGEAWIKKMSVKNFKEEAGNIMQGYETGTRFFRRLSTAHPDGTTDGLKNLVFDPIRQGERLASAREKHLRNVELKSVRRLNKKQAEQLFMYTASKQPEYVEGVVSVPWSKLDPKVKKAYIDIKRVTEKYYPEVKKASRLRGREIGEVINYSPLYVRSDIKIMDKGLFDWTRKDPYFSSIKARTKHVPVELYEKDYRKVIDNWITGLANYLDIGKRTVAVKYLIDSKEFEEIVGGKMNQRIHEWYRYIVNPPVVEGIGKWMKVLRNLQATAILALKDSVVLKQFLNLIDFWTISDSRRLVRGGISEMRKSQLAKVANNSGSVLERSAGIAIQDLKSSVVGWLRKPTEWTDRLTAKMGMTAILDQMMTRYKAEGKVLTPKVFKNMVRKSEDIIDAVMGAMSRSEHPKYFRTEMGKNVNMFYSQLNSKMQFYVSDIFAKQYPFLKTMSKSNLRLFSKAIVALIIGGYVEFVINKLRLGDDPWEISSNVLAQIVGNFQIGRAHV